MNKTYNRYNDVELDTINLDPLIDFHALFNMIKEEETIWMERMSHYTSEKTKFDSAIMWLKLRKQFYRFVGNLSVLNFSIHHATEDYIMLVRRRYDAYSLAVTNAPPYGTHYAKVECLVVELSLPPRYLLVREKYASGPDKYDSFKLVTGVLNLGERLDEACIREVYEETKIQSKFIGMIGVVQRINTRFNRDELIFGCVLHANPGQTPEPDPKELSNAFWEENSKAVGHCNEPTLRWIKAAGRGRTENLLVRQDGPDLRGGSHFLSVFTFRK